MVDLCADLNERNTKRLKFKLFFSIVMTIISLIIYPPPSLINPYQVLIPPSNDATISVYLISASRGDALSDLDDIDEAGIDSVMIMPDMTKMNVIDLYNVTKHASDIGIGVGISLGGEILSEDEYMSDDYKENAITIISKIINESVVDNVDVVEILPYLNAPEDYGVSSGDISEYVFGPLVDDVKFLEELVDIISTEDVITRTSVHVTYSRSFRTLLGDLSEIENLDQVGINFFQSHINTVPTSISSAVEHCKKLSKKEVIVGAIGYSTHDDAHNEIMQDSWFWSCMDVVNSMGLGEVSIWQWNDVDEFPFIVPEIVAPKYGISDKPVLSSISKYHAGDTNSVGYTINWIEIIFGTFSTSGSTGIISGNILLSLLWRILLGALIGKKCKLNGTLIAAIIFSGTLIFHFSIGVPITNSPSWWISFITYFYLYASISAGVYQVQVVSTVVRHKKVFGFCDSKDADQCATDFFQV